MIGPPPTVPTSALTLRDYAALAVLAEVVRIYAADNKCGIAADHLSRNCAAHAYRLADALLTERAK